MASANEAHLRRAEDRSIVFVDEDLVEADPPGFGSRAARANGKGLMPGRQRPGLQGMTQEQLVKSQYPTLNPGSLQKTAPTG
ncbi:hypothetical protein COY32_04020 [candidate division WWE3 bacterium CG_4_10_14_0_2_um_filter_41_14]|uniref:Uncharacterized protein n=1 Tax=candidate division WWE3 bacterium CG_4_10_14_0_2_um_filter_41_14 TaxID=1975072 RepID=A0A2M7TIC0_UNCKA|nr:MAG: hypothetical protein COY32_04020 [candidate division WWE3 bacterium CG_4_10_14_0_2_um_filter_41_14]